MNTITLLLLLGALLIATLPKYGYSREWGYYPSGIVAVIMLIVAVALLHSSN